MGENLISLIQEFTRVLHAQRESAVDTTKDVTSVYFDVAGKYMVSSKPLLHSTTESRHATHCQVLTWAIYSPQHVFKACTTVARFVQEGVVDMVCQNASVASGARQVLIATSWIVGFGLTDCPSLA
jgi:hypothetical protein